MNNFRGLRSWSTYLKQHPFGLVLGAGALTAVSSALYFTHASNSQPNLIRLSTISNSAGYNGPDELRPDKLKSVIQNYADYVLVGGGVSAATAAKVIRAQDPRSSVLLISDDKSLPYNKSALRRELWLCTDEQRQAMTYKKWDDKEASLYVLDEDCYTTEGPTDKAITILKPMKVKKLDVKNQVVILENDWAIKFDKCLIATGSTISSPAWYTEACQNPVVRQKMIKLQTLDDFNHARSILLQNARSVAIVGYGAESCELAYTLATAPDIKAKVKLFCTNPKGLMGHILPSWFSKECAQSLSAVGIEIHNGVEIERVRSVNDSLMIYYSRPIWNAKSEADLIIMADRDSVSESIEHDGTVEISNKELLATSDLRIAPNVWCAGSACKFYNVAIGSRCRWTHYEGSIATGRIAGANMSSENESKPVYRQPMFWVDVGQSVSMEAVGKIDSKLDIESVILTGQSEVEMSHSDPYQAVLFYKENGFLVGILTWNIFGKLQIMRQILSEHLKNPNSHELVCRIMQEKDQDMSEEDSQEATNVFKEK